MSADPKPFDLPDEPFANLLARFIRVPSPRTETERYVIHHNPRMSASMLARYVVSDPVMQQTILKNSKCATKSVMNRYRFAKPTIASAFKGGAFDREALKEKAKELKAETGDTQDAKDSRLGGKLLENLAAIDFPLVENAEKIKRPDAGWNGIILAGVEVAFEPNVVFSFTHRKATKLGAILIHSNKQTPLDKELHGNAAGDYVSALLYRMLEEHLQHIGGPLASHCFAVDAHLQRAFSAPKKFKTLFSHMEASCKVIAQLWKDIPIK